MLEASTIRPLEAAAREGAQQLRGRQVVVADVVGDVGDVGAEADHRGLVADRGHALHRGLGDGRVAQVGLEELGARVEVVRALAVRGRQQRVDDPDLLAALEQRVDDVRADEAGASRDQDHGGEGTFR